MSAAVFHIITYGCQMNVNDSSWLAGALTAKGLEEGPLPEADIVIINTCSVREKPEQKVRATLGRVKAETAGRSRVCVCVCGCVAQQLGKELFTWSPQVRLVCGGDSTAQIPASLLRLLENPSLRLCLTDFTETYDERSLLTGPAAPSSYVNIMQGCDNFCTYCIVPYTRGRQKSRSSQTVLEECRSLVERGAKEITLLGQNVNAYGRDKTGDGTTFASLVRQISAIPGLHRIRYTSPHPQDMSDEDIALFGELDNLCPRLHLPVQSGSNRILSRMNRHYTREDFLRITDKLRRARPDIALSTDLIVAFPGETEENFKDTLALVQEAGFVASYSFRYSPRPGTRAALYPEQIPADEALERLQRLQQLQDMLTEQWLATRTNSTTQILLEQPSPRQDSPDCTHWQGRDPWGAPVHVPLTASAEAGMLVDVTIVRALKHSLQAACLEDRN